MSETQDDRRQHIPASLQSLEWRQWSDDTPVENGDKLLVAVPVCDDASRNDRWHYECEVVTVNCDDAGGGGYFELSGSEFSPCEVEFFVRIK